MPKIFSEGGYSNISETTGNRQMELGYDIFRVGCGEHSPIFIFFYPTRKVSNPRLHLTVSCRFQNSFGIEFSFLPCSNSRTPLARVHETPVGEDILFCGRNKMSAFRAKNPTHKVVWHAGRARSSGHYLTEKLPAVSPKYEYLSDHLTELSTRLKLAQRPTSLTAPTNLTMVILMA